MNSWRAGTEFVEQSFILGCLTHCLYPDRPLPAPLPGLDWDRVYGLLCWHRLTGLFYHLSKKNRDLWPQDLRERLREDRYRALLRGDQCTKQVQALLAALDQAGIAVLVLKGWALIPTLYGGDHGQRIYGDIDLLVHPHDAARAKDVVLGLGYQADPEPWPGFARRYRISWIYRQQPQAVEFGPAFGIGLHWGLLNTPFYFRRIAVAELFERARPVQVAGCTALRLGAEDDLVYACGHEALHHGYDGVLFRRYEMAAALLQTGPGLDWDAVVARSRAWRLVLPVQRVLANLQALWPGIVPARAAAETAALRPGHGERLVHGWLVRYRENHTARALLAWLTMPGLGRRWRYLLEHAFPGPEYLHRRYGPPPGRLWPLLYLRHFGLAAQYGVAALGRLSARDMP